ncbi:isochorismate synthase [Heyndrickxia sp. NPDC080065]|uniref:isochorismate synthase n=1 Tax=Heyndrickxia sp. NPDC080065 TaxID=3390568 RepID=UPI003D046438
MTRIKQSNIETEYKVAVDRARNKKKTILFSYTEKLNNINPLSFYSSAKQLFQGERFFWKVPNDETYIVGLGVAQSLQTSHEEDRFKWVEREWNLLIKDAHIFNPFEVPGTGPLIFGGFSFDPLSVKEQEWSLFSNALFHLPNLMLVINGQEAYITMNIICSTKESGESLKRVLALKEKIFTVKERENLTIIESLREHEINPDEWKEAVGEVVRALKEDNDLNKVVMARKMNIEFNELISSEKVLEHLCKGQQDSYIFALEIMNSCFTGASPERLVKKSGNDVLSACLAGSIKRDSNEKRDAMLGQDLLADMKNRHEHQLVVSMIEDVIQKFCTEVAIPKEPSILKMRDIQHLFTPVKGKIKDQNISILSLVEELHPTPAMGGVPTKDALKVIREMEKMDRGFYAAPIGWIDYRANGEFAVAIRSGLIKENEAFLYAGCGVVSDSNPEDEYYETRIKFRPMLRALGGKML